MALTSAQVAVGTTETALNTADGDDWTKLTVKNAGANPIFLGPTGVTTTNGFSLAAGSTITLELEPGDVVFGRVAAATEAAHVLRVV